jgi:hypothetical protein
MTLSNGLRLAGVMQLALVEALSHAFTDERTQVWVHYSGQ